MTLLVPWLLFPVVLGLISLGCGLLLERVAGTAPGALLLPGGLAVVVVLGLFTTTLSATAELTIPLVLAAAVLGYALSIGRPLPRVRAPIALVVGTFAVYAAPVVLTGRATFTGYVKLDDTASFLGFTDQIMAHGRDLSGLAPSTYERLQFLNIHEGYPVGTFIPLGVGSRLVGQDPTWVYQPCMAFFAAMLALALYALLRGRRPVGLAAGGRRLRGVAGGAPLRLCPLGRDQGARRGGVHRPGGGPRAVAPGRALPLARADPVRDGSGSDGRGAERERLALDRPAHTAGARADRAQPGPLLAAGGDRSRRDRAALDPVARDREAVPALLDLEPLYALGAARQPDPRPPVPADLRHLDHRRLPPRSPQLLGHRGADHRLRRRRGDRHRALRAPPRLADPARRDRVRARRGAAPARVVAALREAAVVAVARREGARRGLAVRRPARARGRRTAPAVPPPPRGDPARRGDHDRRALVERLRLQRRLDRSARTADGAPADRQALRRRRPRADDGVPALRCPALPAQARRRGRLRAPLPPGAARRRNEPPARDDRRPRSLPLPRHPAVPDVRAPNLAGREPPGRPVPARLARSLLRRVAAAGHRRPAGAPARSARVGRAALGRPAVRARPEPREGRRARRRRARRRAHARPRGGAAVGGQPAGRLVPERLGSRDRDADEQRHARDA